MGPLSEESVSHSAEDEKLRALSARAARWVSSASYLKKWIVLGVVIGAVAGLGAVVFYEALVVCTHLFLGVLAGYSVTEVRRGMQHGHPQMTVADLLRSQRGWGPKRSSKVLRSISLSDSKTLGSLTARQRAILVAVLDNDEPTRSGR